MAQKSMKGGSAKASPGLQTAFANPVLPPKGANTPSGDQPFKSGK